MMTSEPVWRNGRKFRTRITDAQCSDQRRKGTLYLDHYSTFGEEWEETGYSVEFDVGRDEWEGHLEEKTEELLNRFYVCGPFGGVYENFQEPYEGSLLYRFSSWLLWVGGQLPLIMRAESEQLDMDDDFGLDFSCPLLECDYCGDLHQFADKSLDHECYGTRGEAGEAAMRSDYEMDYYSGNE